MTDSMIGSVVAGYRLERPIGRGGMGIVYEAVELELGRRVAVKVIAPELANEAGFRRRFVAESRVAASIEHPAVLPIYRAAEADGVLFLAMRLVAGDDLATTVRRDGPLPPTARPGSSPRSPAPWTPRTPAALCIATSSPPTS